MAGGDFAVLTWSNNNSPYLNESNLQQYDDKLAELDDNFRRDKTYYFGQYKDYMYQRNTKSIEDFSRVSDWTESGSTKSEDKTNTIMNNQSIQCLEPNNTASYVSIYKTTSSTIDLTTFIDGSSSSTSDIILIIIYCSDTTKINTVYIDLGDDGSNYMYIGVAAASLSNGWNVLTPQKSDFLTIGSPTGWDTIDYINCEWLSLANASNEYVSFQYIQMVREDADYAGYMNPFQLDEGNIFTINTDYYCLYNDNRTNEIGWFKIDPENSINCMSLNYSDCLSFSAKFTIQCTEAGELCGIGWFIDSDNWISMYVESDTLHLFLREAASNTDNSVALNTTLNQNDIVNLTFEKDGTTARVIFESEGTVTLLEDTTTLNSNTGDLYHGGISTDSYGLVLNYIISPNSGMLLPTKNRFFKLKLDTESLTSNTTMQNDDYLYLFLKANRLYRIQVAVCAKGANAGGIKIDWELTGTAIEIANTRKCRGPNFGSTDPTDTNMRTSVHNIATDVSYGLDSTTNFISEEFMVRTFDGYGKAQMRWAQQASNGTATEVTNSSYIIAEEF